MFICCNKSLQIKEGNEHLDLPRDYMGNIDDRWATHWYVQAAMRDGTIKTNEASKPVKSKL